MKKITFKTFMLVCCLFVSQYSATAHDLTYKVPIRTQVKTSTQIIEGKVISKKSYWDANRQNIYTVNVIEVYKVFKGQQLSKIEIITIGGSVGLEAQIVTPSLQLNKHDVGVFMLKPNTVNITTGHTAFETYSDTQGFYKYNVFNNTVVNPYRIYQGITNFYDTLTRLTHDSYSVVKSFNLNTVLNKSGGLSVSSISPTTATAGTFTQLTINGTGFGSTVQNIGFSNPDDAGATLTLALDTQIISWSDSQIIVEIPSKAGTGQVSIVNSAADAILGTSAQTLTIEYAQLNINSDALNSGIDIAYSTQHVNDDGNGGYNWQMFTDFDTNTAAKESFVRALDSWRCTTDVYWTVGSVTSTDVNADDGVNVIRFDNGNELPNGVLGVCVSRFSGCFANGGTDIDWYVDELDIVFDDGTNWEFGPATPAFSEFDFESVSLHELGHGHQLDHVINNNVVMHFALSNGTTRRIVNTGDINGANDIQSRSTSTTVCSTTPMLNFDCSSLSISEEQFETEISIYPNPTQDIIYIRSSNLVRLDNVDVYDINGRLILQKKLTDTYLNQIDMSNVSKGVYFLTVTGNDNSITEKIIIQ